MRRVNILFNHPISRIIVGIITCLAVSFLFKEFLAKPILNLIFLDTEIAKIIQYLLSVIVMLLTYYVFFKYYEKRKILELELNYLPREFSVGILSAFALIAFFFIILNILGYYEILGVSKFSIFLLPLATLLLASCVEEILFRGILYRILESWIGTKWALIIPSIIFGVVHFTNENASVLGIIGATIGGLILSIMFTYSRRLWLPIAFHLGWNFSQNYIWFKNFGIR